MAIVLALAISAAAKEDETKADRSTPPCPLIYINTAFENTSPLFWEIGDSGEVNVFLMYDHERSSVNRAAGHWHFRVEAPKGSEVTIVLNNLQNIYNGRKVSPASERTIRFVSPDGGNWRAVEMDLLDGHRLTLTLQMEADQMYVARLVPYRLSDLKKLLDEIRDRPRVEITKIGETVEGRPLEMVRVGSRAAPHRVLIRALETWIGAMIAQGRRPDLMIDFHNDEGGRLHISRPNIDLQKYLERMKRFESLLREDTWFTEGPTGGNYRNPGTIGEGLLERYGIHACVHELNANWIAGLDTYPSGKNWELYGEQLCKVFYELFGDA